MGVVQTCIKQRNSDHQIEKQIIQHPHKQNTLIPPLSQLGGYHESLERLELQLQENNNNFSINKTATFNSSSVNGLSISFNKSLNLSLNSTTPNPQINHNLSFQEFSNYKDEEIIFLMQDVCKQTNSKKKEGYAKIISSNSKAKRVKNTNNDDSSISLQRDSETNTKKYFEKQTTNYRQQTKKNSSLNLKRTTKNQK